MYTGNYRQFCLNRFCKFHNVISQQVNLFSHVGMPVVCGERIYSKLVTSALRINSAGRLIIRQVSG